MLYREQQAQKRAAKAEDASAVQEAPTLSVRCDDGTLRPLDAARIHQLAIEACEGVADVDPERVTQDTLRNLYDQISESDLAQAPTLAARALIESEPNYSTVAARLLLDKLRHEALTKLGMATHYATHSEMRELYPSYFGAYVKQAIEWELLDPTLAQYDIEKLGAALDADRDNQFNFLGLQTLYDRYFLHNDGVRFELPQAFFMRVAMGLAINEVDREDRAIEFYRLLSSFDFMSSTPTLFNSGTPRPQLSSCYLTTVPDDLHGIFGAVHDNAMLSKFAGGLGNDWTPVRGMGAYIKGTNGKSQGVVPFLKVANDTAVAVNQGGKRKGAVCAYLETWHRDIEEFVELRKNTGDERRRTHDMNTANWVPDLFMQRVLDEGQWTLFSPDDVPDLHDLTGEAFAERYAYYEDKADRGEIRNYKRLPAVQLWRKMLGQLFETGHPWIHLQGPLQPAQPAAARGRGAQLQPVHRDHAEHLGRQGNRRVQPGFGEPGPARRRGRGRRAAAGPREAGQDRVHRDAHARQRHRVQLLLGGHRARLQPAPPPGGPRCHGLPGRAVQAEPGLRERAGGRVCRCLDGADQLPRHSGLDRPGRRAWRLQELRRFAVEPGHPADRLDRKPGRHAQARAPGAGPHAAPGLGQPAHPGQDRRNAQFQLHGHRPDGDHRQHHRRVAVDRADLPEPLRQIEPVGRLHRHQPLPRRRAQGPWHLGCG